MTIPATVGILTFNSGKTIRRALESVKDFDDIVLCDGGSTDGTLEIAREYGARVIAQDARFKTPENRLRDYGGVRQQTLEAARYDWFLYIDSDETLSEGLREEIRTVVSSFLEEGSSLVYRVPIGIMLDGRYIKYSSNYPGYQHRFFNRKSNAHFEKPVHEHIVFDSASVAIGTLKNPWYIYTTMNDWIHYLRETANYRPLEIASACEGPFTWHGYIYNTAWWHFRAAIGVLLRAGSNYLRHGFKDSVPVRGELGRAAALLLTVYLVTTCRLKQLFSHKEKSVRKIYYVANARMPSEKAHGIQIAKMCEAFIEAGADITLVVPNRKTDSRSLREYYGLRVDVPIHRIPTLEFARYERFGYFLMLCAFSLSYTLFLLGRTLRGERFILYTVDLDTYSSSALALFPEPLYTEMHGGKPKSFLQKILFKKLSGVITINTYIRDELKKNFPTSRANYIVEPNGVDATAFVASGRTAARTQLGIPTDARVVLYTGRFFEWKGLEIIVQAAALDKNNTWYVVGGTREEFCKVIKNESIPESIVFPGSVPHQDVPLWLSAADALLVLGTKRDTQSYFYTSPMKLFEYLLSDRVIVASRTPAIESIVSEKEAVFYEPDNAESLLAAVNAAIQENPENTERRNAATRRGQESSWSGRATRILDFIHHEKRS